MNKCAQSFLFKLLLVLVCMALWGPAAAAQTTPTPGQNINIASGPVQVQLDAPTTHFNTILGDPFLQRQNEPSIAVSTVNPLHLLAGGNDYRAVDIPFLEPDALPSRLVGDAWCGWFSSTDGGLRWQSTLLPGFPQDTTPLGMKSPLHGYKACSDATVRPGPGGMFYYSGIAFNRDTNQSVVFVARFLDRNYAEKGNVALNTAAIEYVDTVVVDTGTTGQFIDKTWNAVLLQSSSATPCSIQVPKYLGPVYGATDPAQTETVKVPLMSVYVVWSRFTGSTSSKIMVTQSQNCGNLGTYGALFKVSESNSINQGTVVAVNQATGDIHLAWRRFGISKTQPDAIVAVKCIASLKSCSKTIDVTANLAAPYKPFKPLDQPSTKTAFRTNSMPAMAVSVDTSGISRVHLAFAARIADATLPNFNEARILMATSTDGVTWPGLQIQEVEQVDSSHPILDENGQRVVDKQGNYFTHGHQLMPAMTFTEGKLMIAYYFSHFDHTVGLFEPNEPNGVFGPDPITGKFFKEFRDPRRKTDLADSSFYSSLDDASSTSGFVRVRRHTLDVRLAQADVNDLTFPNPTAHAMVSRYVIGLTTSSKPCEGPDIPGGTFEDCQANPPDLALFANGNNAFIGDYIDVAGSMFIFVQGSGWIANNAPKKAALHYVVWADNRDVQPPYDGDYSNFTAVGTTAGGQSFFDRTQTYLQSCIAGRAGIKDQNIYISPITQGFVFSVPQNMKPLGFKPGSTTELLDRAFTALLNNFTKDPLHVQLTIFNQPPVGATGTGRASFDQNSQQTTIPDVLVPAHSGISRAVFVRSSVSGLNSLEDVSIKICADQITTPGVSPVPCAPSAGFSASVVLNAAGNAGKVSTLLQPEGVPPSLDITTLEAYNGSLKSGSLKSGSLKSGSLKSGSLKSGSLKSGSLKSGSLKSGSLKSGSLKSTSIADIDSATASTITTNGNEVDPSISNTCTASSPNDFITDAIYVLSNEGNTIATYTIRLTAPPTGSCPVQLIIAQPGLSVTSQGCELVQQDETIVLANITDLANLGDYKVSVPPNESLLVTIRGASIDIVEDATENAAPLATPPGNSDGTPPTTSTALFIIPTPLPDGTFGASYPATTLQATGGTLPYVAWTVIAGSLPPGLTLDLSTGTISGTPSQVCAFGLVPALDGSCTYTFKVQVCDSNLLPGTSWTPCSSTVPFDFDRSARKTLTLTVQKANQTITVTTPAPASAAYNTSFLVVATASSGLPVDITVTGVCSGGGSGSATIQITSGAGICTVHYNQAGDSNYNPAPEVTSNTTATKANAVIVVTPYSVTYDGAAHTAAGTATGVLGESLSGLDLSGTTHTNAGTYSTDAWTFTDVTGNYKDANSTVSDYIGKATASVTPAAASKTYGAADPPFTGTLSGFLAADNVTASYSRTAGETVGPYIISATLGPAGVLGNYNITYNTASFTIYQYNFNGFLSPLATAAGTFSNPTMVPGTTNRGSVVPLKWILTDFSGTPISDLSSLTLLRAIPNAACTGAPSASETANAVTLYAPTSGAAGGSTFRFTGPPNNQFIFNWDTSTTINSAAGCFTVVMQLNDGSAARAITIKFQ